MRSAVIRHVVRGLGLALGVAACSKDATGPTTGTLKILSGDQQVALVGYPTNLRPAVRVLAAGNNPVAGVSVTFAVTAGGGSITGPTSVTTGANGIAQIDGWTVGSVGGTNTLSAAAAVGGGLVTFTAFGVQPSFNIIIQNVGPPLSAAVQTAFNAAVVRWEQIIYEGLPAVANFTAAAGDCGPGTPADGPETINDIKIMVLFDSIDGPGKVLGQSGPCYIRNAPDYRTVLGVMRFDTADVAGLVAAGRINDVILHEMAHVFGYGSLWAAGAFGCLKLPATAGTFPDTYYSCARALAEFDTIGGTSYTGLHKVPLENCAGITGCGTGTFNAHWRESTFFNELMTGYLNSGTSNPLSVLTIAAMGDMGYSVNYGAASPYTRTFSSSVQAAPVSERLVAPAPIALGDDIAHIPIRVVDRGGTLMRVIPARR